MTRPNRAAGHMGHMEGWLQLIARSNKAASHMGGGLIAVDSKVKQGAAIAEDNKSRAATGQQAYGEGQPVNTHTTHQSEQGCAAAAGRENWDGASLERWSRHQQPPVISSLAACPVSAIHCASWSATCRARGRR